MVQSKPQQEKQAEKSVSPTSETEEESDEETERRSSGGNSRHDNSSRSYKSNNKSGRSYDKDRSRHSSRESDGGSGYERKKSRQFRDSRNRSNDGRSGGGGSDRSGNGGRSRYRNKSRSPFSGRSRLVARTSSGSYRSVSRSGMKIRRPDGTLTPRPLSRSPSAEKLRKCSNCNRTHKGRCNLKKKTETSNAYQPFSLNYMNYPGQDSGN